MTTLDFYLVRHGQSHGQACINGLPMHLVPLEKRPPGIETRLMEDDWFLTSLGRKQAALLGAHLAQTPFDMIFCSPLERARATAQAVADHQPASVPIQVMRDLLEIGDWGDETPAEVYARAQKVFAAIRAQSPPGARVLVAAHGSVNNRLLAAMLGLPLWENSHWRFSQENTGLSRTIFSEVEPPRLCCMNDLSHLTPQLREETKQGFTA